MWRVLFSLLYTTPYEHGFYSKEDVQKIGEVYGDIDFDVVHLYRLWALPAATPYLEAVRNRGGHTGLDVDDLESKLRFRSAKLLRNQIVRLQSINRIKEGYKFRILERRVLPEFDRVIVCAEGDRIELKEKFKLLNIKMIPNAVNIPVAENPKEGGLFTILFIGTMSYQPNEDAVLYFTREVLPILREKNRF